MPSQHFFMFHDVTWVRHSKQVFSLLSKKSVLPFGRDDGLLQRYSATVVCGFYS